MPELIQLINNPHGLWGRRTGNPRQSDRQNTARGEIFHPPRLWCQHFEAELTITDHMEKSIHQLGANLQIHETQETPKQMSKDGNPALFQQDSQLAMPNTRSLFPSGVLMITIAWNVCLWELKGKKGLRVGLLLRWWDTCVWCAFEGWTWSRGKKKQPSAHTSTRCKKLKKQIVVVLHQGQKTGKWNLNIN